MLNLLEEGPRCLGKVQKESEAGTLRDIAVLDNTLVVYDTVKMEEQWDQPTPLFLLHPNCDCSSQVSDWVIFKAKEMQTCIGIRCDGFEDQYITLFASIEVEENQASSSPGGISAKKRARELKKLVWSIKDEMGERSSN